MRKNLRQARQLLERGIARARVQADPDLEQPLQYDLASFCWPGWNEVGVKIRAADLKAGEEAAEANLHLGLELKRDHATMADAWFLVGAYHLMARRTDQALNAFIHGQEYAIFADDPERTALTMAFSALAFGGMDVEAICDRLRASSPTRGDEFVRLVHTAAALWNLPLNL